MTELAGGRYVLTEPIASANPRIVTVFDDEKPHKDTGKGRG